MVLMMACELTFDPNRKENFPKLPRCRGAGVATGRWARRHAAPAVVGRFIFFRDSAWFFLAQTRVLGFMTTNDGRNRAPPLKTPGSSNRKSPKFYRQFFWRFKNETADDGGGCVSPRPTARSYPSPTARQFGKVPLSVGVEKVSSQAIISTMVAPSHRNEV